MAYGITQPYLPPGSSDFPAFTPAEACTLFINPGGMQGCIDLSDPNIVYWPKMVTYLRNNQTVEQYERIQADERLQTTNTKILSIEVSNVLNCDLWHDKLNTSHTQKVVLGSTQKHLSQNQRAKQRKQNN